MASFRVARQFGLVPAVVNQLVDLAAAMRRGVSGIIRPVWRTALVRHTAHRYRRKLAPLAAMGSRSAFGEQTFFSPCF